MQKDQCMDILLATPWDIQESIQTAIPLVVIVCLLVDIYLYDSPPWTQYITQITQYLFLAVVYVDCITRPQLEISKDIYLWIVLSAAILAHVFHRKIPRLRAINSTLESTTFILWMITNYLLVEEFTRSMSIHTLALKSLQVAVLSTAYIDLFYEKGRNIWPTFLKLSSILCLAIFHRCILM